MTDIIVEAIWPVTLLAILWSAKPRLERILGALEARIRDPNSDVAISKEGLEIKSKLQEIEIDQEQTKSLALKALGVPDPLVAAELAELVEVQDDDPSAVPVAGDPGILAAAETYMHIEDPKRADRVRKKDAAARKLAEIVLTRGVSREWLATQDHEGLILALASASHTLPLESDLGLLISVAEKPTRLHVKYRIMMAMGRLYERGLASPSYFDQSLAVARRFKEGADKSLLDRIANTENLIRQSN